MNGSGSSGGFFYTVGSFNNVRVEQTNVQIASRSGGTGTGGGINQVAFNYASLNFGIIRGGGNRTP